MQPPSLRPARAGARLSELDGLRCLAVFPVLYQHWFEPRIQLGSWGVILFFVISGYVISRLILADRDKGRALTPAAARFFFNRARRLMPAYFFVLALGLLVQPEVRAAWPWYAFFGSNLLPAWRDAAIPLQPTWSLAVEQQFYLLWFFVLMLVPLRRLPLLLVAMLVGAVLFRALVFDVRQGLPLCFLPACLDALGAGALLCLAERRGLSLPRGAGWIALAAIAWSVAVCGQWLPCSQGGRAALVPAAVTLASAWAVWRARTGFGGVSGALLGSAPMAYLGRISYGIYLYHMVTKNGLAHSGLHVLPGANVIANLTWLDFPFHILATVAVASLSYHWLERPIQRLRFPMPLTTGAAARA